jgi:predicted nucleic acid-binding protein
LISALTQKGKPRELLFKIIKEGHELAVSKDMLEEFAEVAAQPKIRSRIVEHEIQDSSGR